MQNVNVYENGIGYLLKCLRLYNGGTGFFVMYLFALIFIMLKGDRRERGIFLPGAFVFLVTVYNPIMPLVLDAIFDVNSEYYRLFWAAPVVILVPYVITKLVYAVKEGTGRMAAVVIAFLVTFAGGKFLYAEGFTAAQNIYKIPDELAQISAIIHEDSQTEYTRAFFEYEYNMEIRQYDPKMLLCVDREDYIYAMNYSYTEEMLDDETSPSARILALLVRNQRVSTGRFTDALESTNTEYVVLTAGHPQAAFLRRAGLYEIARTDTHIIYKYDLKAPSEFELVDYSGAEHKFSYRRLK